MPQRSAERRSLLRPHRHPSSSVYVQECHAIEVAPPEEHKRRNQTEAFSDSDKTRAFPGGARPIPESRSKTGAPRVAHVPRLADLDSEPENNHTWRPLLSREFGSEYSAPLPKSNSAGNRPETGAVFQPTC